jgi:hypothetical protein
VKPSQVTQGVPGLALGAASSRGAVAAERFAQLKRSVAEGAPRAESVIRVGGPEAEYLTLMVHGRNRPQDTEYWDSKFPWCTAEVSAGAFCGSVSNVLRNEALARLLSWLEALSQQLDGEALLDTLNDWQVLHLTRRACRLSQVRTPARPSGR